MPDNTTPLPLEMWFERVDIIASGALGSIENALRHACHLLQILPDQLRQCVNWQVDESRMEKLLDAQRFDDAARELLGTTSGLRVAVVSGNYYRAALTCTMSQRTVTGHGRSEATAIIAAATTCLLGIRDDMRGPARRSAQRPTHH